MRIEILMIGKYTDKAYKALVEDYLTRCRGRISAEVIHCRNEDEMRSRISNAEFIVALDEHGNHFDSIQFADRISAFFKAGLHCVTFCLGPAAGLPSDIKNAANEKLALSKLTLNHQLALLTLSEQLYRALSILNGEPYHKA